MKNLENVNNNPHKSETLIGMIEDIIYHNEENGYTVFKMRPEDNPDPLSEAITCTGYLADPAAGESISALGGFCAKCTVWQAVFNFKK